MSTTTSAQFSGLRCEASVIDGVVVKEGREVLSATQASNTIANVIEYDRQLSSATMHTPKLLGANVVPLARGKATIRVRQEFIPGKKLSEMEPGERVEPTRRVLGSIASMPATRLRGLITPIDAWSDNFIVSPKGTTVFVDITPPMVRDAKGHFDYPGSEPFYKLATSRPALVMARLLHSISHESGKPIDREELRAMMPDNLVGMQKLAVRALSTANHFGYRLIKKFGAPVLKWALN